MVAVSGGRAGRLTFADFAEYSADALFGQAGQTFTFALLTFQAFQRGEESRCLRLAK
jgi:hypothetical protein